MESMELKNLISSSETVDVYRVGDMAIKLFKEGCRKTMPLYEALTHSRVEDTGLNIPIIREAVSYTHLVENLIRLGHQKIAIISNDTVSYTHLERIGWPVRQDCLQRHLELQELSLIHI